MTVELWYLFLSSILLAILWIPPIMGSAGTAGLLKSDEYRKLRNVELPDWARRANRAHLNLVEQFGAFAGLVVVAHLAGVSNYTTEIAAAVFFWSRIVHVVVFLAGWSFFRIRTVIFTVAFAALIVMAAAIYFGL